MIQQEYIFLCDRDGKRMDLIKGKYSYYRRCENYLFKNRENSDKVCMNRMYIHEIKDLREELMRREREEGLSEGDRGQAGKIIYRIGKINRYRIEVFVRNIKFLKSEGS